MGSASTELLCKKLVALREGTSEYRRGENYSQPRMMDEINKIIQQNEDYYEDRDITIKEKTFLRRLEKNEVKDEVIIAYAELYFEVFELSEETRDKIRNANKIVVLDSASLMNMPHILKTFGDEYYKIIICDFIKKKIDDYKSKKNTPNSKKARKVLNELNDLTDKVVVYEYEGDESISTADKIWNVAQETAQKYTCNAVIISDDKSISVGLLGKESASIEFTSLVDYSSKRQHISPENIDKLKEIRNQNDKFEGELNLPESDMNSFFIDGRTLLSACIVDKGLPPEAKKKKIKWLQDNGADINFRDCASDFFPPLTTAVQRGEYDMVSFLLDECGADPNVGSRYPYSKSTVGIQNEGNTPLMVAAYQGLDRIVKKLCGHPQISINQQDRNGYTALIKACINGHDECKSILEEFGADSRIRDFNGKTAMEHYSEYKKKETKEDKIKRLESQIKKYEIEIKKRKDLINKLK